MKVALVSFRFLAPGGVETNVWETAVGLRRAGADVTVFAGDLYDEGRWERRTDRPARVDGVAIEWFPTVRRMIPFVTMPMFPGLIDGLARVGPDIVHAHSHRYGHVLQSALYCAAGRAALVVSAHYHPADRRESTVKRVLLRGQDVLFGATAYRIARRIVVETERERRLLRPFAPAGKIVTIPPGIDVDAWKAEESMETPFPLPPRYVLYAGRIAPNKGLELLLSALATVPAPRRPALVLMGRDWGERARLQAEAARLGIAPQVHWLGHVHSRADYRAVFRRAAAFVLPSEWEAFGIVLLEAMAAGTPIVATSVGGVPEVLQEGRCGRLVPFGDATALARAIVEVDTDAAGTQALVEQARRRVEGFTWERAISRHLELYRGLRAGRRSTPAA